MKLKYISLLAAPVFCMTTGAFASSNIELYGHVDTGVRVISPDKIDGKRPGTVVKMESGQYVPNLIGLKGEEDLGSGYKAGFVLEQTFTENNGAQWESGYQFDNQSYLYVAKDSLKVAFGRLKGVSSTMGDFDIGVYLEPFEGSWDDAGGSVFALIGQSVKNGIAATAEPAKGVSLTAMYSLGLEDQEVAPYAANQHYTGVSGTYSTEKLWSGFSYEYISKGKVAAEDLHVVKVGVNYDFGPVRPYLAYSFSKGVNWYGEDTKANSFILGAKAPVAGGDVLASAQWLKGKKKTVADGTFEPEKVVLSVGYTYPFSKRTVGYAVYSWSKGMKSLSRGEKSGYAMGSDRDTANRSLYSVGIAHFF